MSDLARPRILLIDGHSMAYRAFFALPVENFATSTGQPTNAVYGFTSMLINVLRDEQPTHVAVAFDVSRLTFRSQLYEPYKGTRAKTPEEFTGQVPLIKEVLQALGITWLEKDDYEADDIIATCAAKAEAAGMQTLICSGDRDSLQLVTDETTVLYPKKGVSELARMTPGAIQDKYGVGPSRYPDLAALVGETSDNLPGVPGVGPKTAAKWLNLYGSLEELVANADQLSGKAGANLREHLDQVVLNRRLGQLVRDLELPVAVEDMTFGGWDRELIHQVFDALQFRTLRERLLAMLPDAGTQDLAGGDPSTQVEYSRLVPATLAQWLANHEGTMSLATAGRSAAGGGDAWTLAIAARDAAVLIDLADIAADDETVLAQWLADPSRGKNVHGAKDVWHQLRGRGLPLAGVVFDTELAAYLCFPDQRGYDVADLTVRLLHRELNPAESGSQGMLDLPGSSGEDELVATAVAVRDLADALAQQLTDRSGVSLLTDLELPLVDVLALMERTGIGVDLDHLRRLEESFATIVRTAAQEAYAAIGREVNLGSPKQLQEVLFDTLGMRKTKRTKTGYTTDAEALAELYAETQHPFLEHLLAHRDATKLRQTVEGLIKAVGDDGRIHTTFRQTIAATGRLSSTEPNLQNIPVRTDAGRQIRRAFVAAPPYTQLLTADYSQIEMRIMAHLSGDEGLIEAFNSGEDLHSFVASKVFSVPPADVTAPMRSRIKAMSYGLAYGLSAYGLSRQLGIDVADAQALMDDYFERFGGIRDYLSGVVDQARQTGYTQTIMGRRRYLPDLTSDNRQRREMAERMALNAPIQGSAADIIKVAMLRVQAGLERENLSARMLLQVHDELVFEVADDERERLEQLVRTEMGAAADLSVPLSVSVGHGHDWQTAGH